MNSAESHQIRQLLQQYGPSLVLYARQWCQQPDDALQEALIDLLRQHPRPHNMPAWLFKTVQRKAMNLARAERRRTNHHRQASQRRDNWFEESLDHKIVVEEVEVALLQLGGLERQIVVARIWGGLTFEQIGQVVDQSASSVHRGYQRALAQMATMLGEATRQDRDTPSRTR